MASYPNIQTMWYSRKLSYITSCRVSEMQCIWMGLYHNGITEHNLDAIRSNL